MKFSLKRECANALSRLKKYVADTHKRIYAKT